MILLLDTNVVSELHRPRPDDAVLRWFSELDLSTAFLSSLTEGELRAGLALAPAGRKRDALVSKVEYTLSLFRERIVPFGADAIPKAYAAILAARAAEGRYHKESKTDLMIAATATVIGATMVTRNVRDFAFTGVPIIDPWRKA